jgi:hypothetical protein
MAVARKKALEGVAQEWTAMAADAYENLKNRYLQIAILGEAPCPK